MLKIGIFNDTSRNGHFGCLAVMSTIISQLERRNAKIKFSWPLNNDWTKHKNYIERQKLDLIIVNGEGTIHHTKNSNSVKLLLEIAIFSKKINIPAFLINSTIYNVDDESIKLLKLFAKIYVRETGTQNYLSTKGVPSEMVPDLSFFTPFLDEHVDEEHRNKFLFTDSVKRDISKKLQRISEHSNSEFISMVPKKQNKLTYFIKKFISKLQIHFLPKLSPIPKYENLTSFLNKLKKSKLTITGRFHTTTLALATYTPIIAIESNTPKISYILMDIFGDTERIKTIYDIDSINLTNEKEYEYTSKEKNEINTYIKSGKDKLNKMFDDMIEIPPTIDIQ
jgi:polysaccharide pyruvyl transferase WcaK-like protein